MRLYWEVGLRSLRRQMAYRTANLAGLVTNIFFGYVRGALMLAIFVSQDTVAGYDAQSAVTYVWVTQAIIMVVALWGWWEVEATIRSGDVVLHEPEVLYLDEPTIGLDVVAKHRVREFLRTINREQGATVLLTTHDMSDVEQLCSRLLIVDHGRVLYDGSLEAIREQFGTERRLVVDLAEDVVGPLLTRNAREVRADGPRRWLGFHRDDIAAADLIAAVAAAYRVRDLTIEEPAIESIVRDIYEQGLKQPVVSR